MTIEQQLRDVFTPLGLKVRVLRTTCHEERLRGVRHRIKAFQVSRDTGAFAISKRHPYPARAQVTDSQWQASLVKTIATELDAWGSKKESFNWYDPDMYY